MPASAIAVTGGCTGDECPLGSGPGSPGPPPPPPPRPAGALSTAADAPLGGARTQVQDGGPPTRCAPLTGESHTSGRGREAGSSRSGERRLQRTGNLRRSCRAWAPGLLEIAGRRLQPWGYLSGPPTETLGESGGSADSALCPCRCHSLSGRDGKVCAPETHKRGSMAPAGVLGWRRPG